MNTIKVYTYSSEIHKKLMKEDPVYKNHVNNMAKNAMMHRYKTDEVFREKQKQSIRERYANDADYREKLKVKRKERYANDPEFRKKLLENNKKYYDKIKANK